jgi:hypothetical protein
MLSFIDYSLCVIKQVHDDFMDGLDVLCQVIFTKLHQFKIHAFLDQDWMGLTFSEQIFGMNM